MFTKDKLVQVFIDAKDPSKNVSWSQAYHLVRQLITGLKEHGLEEGDTVCCHMYNNVSQVFATPSTFLAERDYFPSAWRTSQDWSK